MPEGVGPITLYPLYMQYVATAQDIRMVSGGRGAIAASPPREAERSFFCFFFVHKKEESYP